MKTKLLSVLSAFVLVMAACQKEHSDDTTNNGSTTDYQPTTAGSTWQYSSTSQGNYTETATGTDTTISGQQFSAIDNSVSGRRYVNKNNGTYTSYGRFPQLDTTLQLTYLKDAAAGTSWEDDKIYTINSFPVPIKVTYTIASRDNDKTVNNITYKNVIAVNTTISANIPLTGEVNVAQAQQFYAKGVGLILQTFSAQVPGSQTTVSDSTYLLSSTIK